MFYTETENTRVTCTCIHVYTVHIEMFHVLLIEIFRDTVMTMLHDEGSSSAALVSPP